MTKKPSEKNKAWEKDRRDRLNKTFDELAKLLPKYDPSVVWSKIEIIQKAFTFITNLQKKQDDYLKTKDPELFREYEEFVNCLKFYQERNAQLTELLKKAKVTLPQVVLPQLLVNKPELLPKVEDVDAVCLQKPKRQRNRGRKSDADAKKTDENEETKEEDKSAAKILAEKVSDGNDTFSQDVMIAKPAAKTLIEMQPPSPQAAFIVPAKPLIIRLRRNNSIRKLKPIARQIFRKCYPNPDRMNRWSIDAQSHQKLISKQRRAINKKLLRKRKHANRLKVKHTPEPIREQSVSPTAAFLLSFPVVTSSMLSGKNVENTENSVSLENLNNFFTTEEYSKFCDLNPVTEERVPTPICTPISIRVPSQEKPSINGKQMTSFTVSSITRPSSPKKLIAYTNQAAIKRLNELQMIENKMIRITPTTAFESDYNFTNTNPMIGSTSMCRTSISSTRQQVSSARCTAINTAPIACFSSTTSELENSVKLEPISAVPHSSKPNSTANFFPRYIHSTSTSNSLKATIESTPKTTLQTNLPTATSWTANSATSAATVLPCVAISSFVCKTSSNLDIKAPPITTTETSSKATRKHPVSSLYSPTKHFFYDLPTQSQPITTFNFNLPSTTSSSTADPLISSTTAKSHSFINFPSIKTEFPWLPPSTTSLTTPLSSKTTTTTATTCNLNTNFTPFDLASIVCESLTSTSLTFSLTTPKSSEPTVVKACNKLNTSNKCNQMNLFIPYEEAQYMPTFPFSLTKPTDSQVYPTARENLWKSEKAKDTITDQIFYDCEQSKPQQKSHVNWMTTPTTDFTSAPSSFPLPPIDFGNQLLPASTSFDFAFGCRKDSYDDDNQFINWSPTKPLSADFSTAYSFDNFGSSEAPPNKTVKQIFSVSQLVDQTPSQEISAIKKTLPKTGIQKSSAVKQTFSNIYSAESLIAKKDNRITNATTSFYTPDVSNNQPDNNAGYNTSNYFYNYPNTQNCAQTENDYLGASDYSLSSTVKITSIAPPAAGTVAAPVIPPFDSTTTPSTTNYFAHSISSNTNDPYDPTYFPSSNYNHPTATNWNHVSKKVAPPVNGYNQNQLAPSIVYGTVEPSNVSGNLTNFNLSSICPEIDGKDGSSGW